MGSATRPCAPQRAFDITIETEPAIALPVRRSRPPPAGGSISSPRAFSRVSGSPCSWSRCSSWLRSGRSAVGAARRPASEAKTGRHDDSPARVGGRGPGERTDRDGCSGRGCPRSATDADRPWGWNTRSGWELRGGDAGCCVRLPQAKGSTADGAVQTAGALRVALAERRPRCCRRREGLRSAVAGSACRPRRAHSTKQSSIARLKASATCLSRGPRTWPLSWTALPRSRRPTTSRER